MIYGKSSFKRPKKLAVVVASEIFDVMKNKEPYNQERYINRLNDLPKEPE